MVSRFATASIHLTTIQTLLSVKCPHFGCIYYSKTVLNHYIKTEDW